MSCFDKGKGPASLDEQSLYASLDGDLTAFQRFPDVRNQSIAHRYGPQGPVRSPVSDKAASTPDSATKRSKSPAAPTLARSASQAPRAPELRAQAGEPGRRGSRLAVPR